MFLLIQCQILGILASNNFYYQLSISTFSTRSDKILEVTSFINYRSLPSTTNNVLYWQNIENISGRKIYFFTNLCIRTNTLHPHLCSGKILKVSGKRFAQPQVAPPFGGDHVSKPHVG